MGVAVVAAAVVVVAVAAVVDVVEQTCKTEQLNSRHNTQDLARYNNLKLNKLKLKLKRSKWNKGSNSSSGGTADTWSINGAAV
jgi:hypothetical protein